MHRKRILIGSPIHQKPEILKEFLECLSCLSQDGIETNYCFIDDNSIESSRSMLQSFAAAYPGTCIIKAEGLNDYTSDESTHYWNNNLVWKVAGFKDMIIRKAVAEDYDYLFLVDSDILIYPDTLQQLISSGRDIISEVFWTQWNPDTPTLPNVWLYDHYDMAQRACDENLTPEESNRRTQDFLEQLKLPGIYEVGMLGACTLISRHALAAGMSFSQIRNLTLWGEDRHFCVRASAIGFKMYVDTSRPAYHIYRESELKGASAFKLRAGLSEPAVRLNPYDGTSCPVCASGDLSKFHDYGSFVLLECRQCGLIFRDVSAVSTEKLISDTYDSDWVEMRDKYIKDTFLEHAKFNNMLLEIFAPNKGRLLEIGSGTGEFLYLAGSAGWKAYGIEPAGTACRYAKERLGLELINSSFGSSLFEPGETFDAIAFWHVLEHIPNPIEFLKEASSLLAPGGIILFSIPNRACITNDIYGAASPLFTEADHFIHFGKKNLLLAIEKAGLSPIVLFTRQEPGKLEAVLSAHPETARNVSFEQLMSSMAGLQSDFKGHEIVCVAAIK